jgi:YVTN family beta-propeller protein
MFANPGAGVGGTGGAAGGDPVLPPEVEVKLDFELPQASERYVYAANPDSGTVVIINAETQVIQTLETGDRPTFLRTLVGTDDAIVLNVGSDDATVIRDPDKGATTSTVDVVRGANAIAVAPDGKHAVVYFNSAFSSAGGESGSFQDVTVIELAEGADSAVGMTVGFRPRDVFFASDGSAAFVATDDGISVLDFASIDKSGSGIARLISLGNDIDQKSLDVSVTPEGRYALARQPGESVIRLVDLQDGSIRTLDLTAIPLPEVELSGDEDAGTAGPRPIEVTDLDLAPTGEFALAVLRNQSAVLRIPVPSAFDDAEDVRVYSIPDQLIGSVTIAPDAKRALLYTTAAEVERITVLDLSDAEEPMTVALRKTIEGVVIAPDGETALIVHKKAPGSPDEPGLDPDAKIDRSFGYSVLRVGSGDVKLQITPIAAGAFTIVPDSGYLFILFRDDQRGIREVQKVEAKSFLVQPIPLGSPPISLGTVPGSERVFVNQDHPDGRITLIDWKTNETRTVTGFELNSRIRD